MFPFERHSLFSYERVTLVILRSEHFVIFHNVKYTSIYFVVCSYELVKFGVFNSVKFAYR